MNELIFGIILGIIQGVSEWLPISSSALLVLAKESFMGVEKISLLMNEILFLHLGTFFAALIYFRKDVLKLINALFNWRGSDEETRKIFIFLLWASLISGFFGFILYLFISSIEDSIKLTSSIILFVLAFFLLITGVLQLKARGGYRKAKGLKIGDGILLGVIQGLSVLPGLSRSGLTVSTLLLNKFDETEALRLSFLMSLPIVLVGNIFLNFSGFFLFSFSPTLIFGFLCSFIFGLLTIHFLINLSKRMKFAYFVLFFSILVFIAGILSLIL